MESRELVKNMRELANACVVSRERAGITYRGVQVSVDELLQLCDAAESGLSK